jgi:hypothetical protein
MIQKVTNRLVLCVFCHKKKEIHFLVHLLTYGFFCSLHELAMSQDLRAGVFSTN